MMPQPVDLQTELGRVSAAERIQQIADRASLASLQRTAEEVAQNRVRQESQVQQTDQPQSEQVEAEAKRRNPFVGRRRHRKEGEPEEEAGHENENLRGPTDDGEGKRFDVSV
ncbi:MAG: hypothetical protein K1Y02_08520 [Candidatus Hydrogenedentes bacterium]|nr:hypothetical protein [Candidatus Hydrogenedentota bacterium]